MAVELATNPVNSYELTVETPIAIETMIKVLSIEDMPMIGGINSDGYPVLSSKPVSNKIFHWQDQDLPVPRTTAAEALDAVETDVDLATGTGVSFAAGDAIKIDDEVMFITAVATDTLTVVRGSAGTTAAVHADGADVIGIGTVLDEGDVGDQQFRGREKRFNFTQIWTSKINMTRTAQQIPKYGVPSEHGNLVRQVMLSEGINMENTLLYGVRWESDPRRTTGGLTFFITTHVLDNAASGNWLTIAGIEAAQQLSYDSGGMFTEVISIPKNFQALNNISGNERVRTEVMDPLRGRQIATSVVTEFGQVNLRRNRHCRATDAFGVNPEDLEQKIMQPMITQPLAKVDDRDQWMFVTERGFKVEGERHMVRWNGLDNTAALPSSGLV